MFKTILGAVGTIFDSLSLTVFAVSLGFSALPSVLGYAVALAGMLIFGQISPIAAQSETLVLVSTMGENRNERLTISVIAEAIILISGITGVIGTIVDFIGNSLMSAVMAGVSIILARTSYNMIRMDYLAGSTSLVSAVIIYLITKNLVYTVVCCITFSTVSYNIFGKEKFTGSNRITGDCEKFSFFRPVVNSRTVRGSLAAAILLLGGTLSDSAVNSQLSGIPLNINGVFTYTGLGGMLSAMFGGPPLAAIISGTAATPTPQLGSCITVAVLIIILLAGILPKIARYIPGQAVCGFLFVLAVFVVFPTNAPIAFSDNPVVSSVTMLVTAVVDPFMGIASGILLRLMSV